ncbi:hypothetical protein [Croceimicrobium sp.]|uniref:hypothetical protein n=1 Tax=Croceimicrobium sp. TaxID=2828340 RepID=UPI003BA918FE
MKARNVLILLIILGLTNRISSQELLRNPSFENRTSSPTYAAQFDKANDWTSRTQSDPTQGDKTTHSPDLYTLNSHTHVINNSNTIVNATDGISYVGAFDFELFQQKMSQKPLAGQLYMGSFDFLISDNGPGGSVGNQGSSINIYLARDEVKYEKEGDWLERRDCTEEYRAKKHPILANQEIHLIASFNLDDYSEFDWHNVQYSFSVEHSEFEYFVVEVGRNVDLSNYGGINCSFRYVLFDNFKLADFCTHPCTPSLSDQKLIYFSDTEVEHNLQEKVIDDYLSIGTIQGQSKCWLFAVENAQYVKLTIRSEWAGNEYIKEFMDPMGLHNVSNNPDPNRKAFILTWEGEWNGGTSAILNETYTYELEIRSCTEHHFFIGAINYIGFSSTSSDAYASNCIDKRYYSPPIPFDYHCCDPGNLNITNTNQYNALSDITTQELTVTFHGSNLWNGSSEKTIYSGEAIELKPSVDLKPTEGSFIELRIYEECRLQEEELSKNGTISNFSISSSEQLDTTQFSLSPNPVASGTPLKVLSSEQNVVEIKIYSINGKLLYNGQINPGENHVSLQYSGMALVRVNGIFNELILFQ